MLTLLLPRSPESGWTHEERRGPSRQIHVTACVAYRTATSSEISLAYRTATKQLNFIALIELWDINTLHLVGLPEVAGEDAVHPVPAGWVHVTIQLREVTRDPRKDAQ